MNIFKAVKEVVSVRDAASFYGLKVSRKGMCKCPFHADKNPSMKVDRRYYCFGCQATGDVIDFVSNYFNIGLKDAALKIADDFGIDIEGISKDPGRKDTVIRISPVGIQNGEEDEPEEEESEEERLIREEKEEYEELMEICDLYIDLLFKYRDHWQKVKYEKEPTPDSEWTDEFVCAAEKVNEANMLLDILMFGPWIEKRLLIKTVTTHEEVRVNE